ncbi:dual specificity protein phosphatase cdc14b-like [Limosa lapponica baueri]|uniref:Dual specificity protein phosphatase cdc14b-like n=1 Tax=Limosa lapponica baueri TaxID=1758121 RepID=A0A2I0U7I6_LIMLA|nr:dual specificity protein phosphatase cdc14b-like [Limosa lapponica baueri]
MGKSYLTNLIALYEEVPELHHLMVTADEDAFDLHIPTEPLVVDEYEVQQNTSPCWLFCHLEEEVVNNAFWEPPGLLMFCYVISPADIGVVELPHEDQDL